MSKLTVITRKAYGGAYVVMGSRHAGADANFAGPSAQIAVMGAQGAVNVVYPRSWSALDVEAQRVELIEQYEEQLCNPWRAAEHGYLDDVIEPSHPPHPRQGVAAVPHGALCAVSARLWGSGAWSVG